VADDFAVWLRGTVSDESRRNTPCAAETIRRKEAAQSPLILNFCEVPMPSRWRSAVKEQPRACFGIWERTRYAGLPGRWKGRAANLGTLSVLRQSRSQGLLAMMLSTGYQFVDVDR
jgi:hypothetical protein